MNFVNQLEDHLRDLGAEAQKKHPGVLDYRSPSSLCLFAYFQDHENSFRCLTSFYFYLVVLVDRRSERGQRKSHFEITDVAERVCQCCPESI